MTDVVKDYQEKAKRTLNHNLPFDMQLATLTLGLVGEFGEIVELTNVASPKIEIEKELGDFQWYLANLHTVLEFEWEVESYSSFATLDEFMSNLSVKVMNFADMVKKVVGHNHEIDRGKFKASLKEISSLTEYMMVDIFERNPASIRRRNIEKLMERYPDGFDSARSINR